MTTKNIETITINVRKEEIRQQLLNDNGLFHGEEINPLQLKIFSNRQVGTRRGPGMNDWIFINVDLKIVEETVTEIELSTKLRIDIKVAIVLYVLVILVALFIKFNYDKSASLLLIFLIPLIPFWPRFIRIPQEKKVIDDVKNFLKRIERLYSN